MKGGKLLDPMWRHERAMKAGAAARLFHLRRARERVKGLTPVEAYNRGYRTALNRSYAYWRRWALRQVERRQAA